MAPCTSSTCPCCGGYTVTRSSWGDTYWFTIRPMAMATTSGWSCGDDRSYTEVHVEPFTVDPARAFNWFRDFEPPRLFAIPAQMLVAAARVWRRLRGADANQVRRHKRKRFVQAISGSPA
jgi:hypothetical protein